ncbi:transporter substrate-binding domain-containing protein [Chitinimonas viridis]|uniref:Transporter substrate-binding domain-containing protein n=1 Tax=Chitinimonas viridis TaxID=664880 RepID=A0ABT8BBV8_9NEIS|nr:transporter substrate-binding domain-containing protein [Chitinimonas viridis]MDN3579076.1 transporter substrate-binding domain-containing protein [Chitinimonas viridis]
MQIAPKVLIRLVCCLACLPTLAAQHKTLKMAFGLGRPPFVYEEAGIWRGFELDIMRTAMRELGYEVDNHHLPNARLYIALSDASFAAAVAVQPEPGDKNCYSKQSISEYVNVAISKSSRHITLNRVHDLSKYSVAAWQKAHRNLGREFEALYGPNAEGPHLEHYTELGDQTAQVRQFWLNRFDVLLIDKTIFAWYRQQLRSSLPTSESVDIHPIFPGRASYYVVFRDCRLRDRFDQVLARMKSNGRYRAAIDSYLE